MCIAMLGGIISAAGSLFSGMAQAAAYKAEAQAKNYQSQSESRAGSYESGIKIDEGKRIIGKQVTGYASSGVDLATGTPGDVIADTASNVNMDVAAIRANWQDKSNLSLYESKIAKMNAKSAAIGGATGALSPLVNSFSGTKTSFG